MSTFDRTPRTLRSSTANAAAGAWAVISLATGAVPVRVSADVLDPGAAPAPDDIPVPPGLCELRDRVFSALRNSGEHLPDARVLLSTEPEHARWGAGIDLAAALAVARAAGSVPTAAVTATVFLAGLGLDGALRPEHGDLSAALRVAREHGHTRAVVPSCCLEGLTVPSGMLVLGAGTLAEVLARLRDTGHQPALGTASSTTAPSPSERSATRDGGDGPATPYELAVAYLMRVAEPPAPALHSLVLWHGAETAARRVRAGTVPTDVQFETGARRHLELAQADIDAARAVGAWLLTPADEQWPAELLAELSTEVHGQRSAPPLGLWVRSRGPVGQMCTTGVAVLGARAATGYGEHCAAEFAHALGLAGHTVIAGGAYGIDGAAHRGALAANAPTVAVLGCGVDLAYPAGHTSLLGRIASQGALLSEYPPGTPPARHRFLVRARLIAALGRGTVIVEAGRRSGVHHTARVARALGRPVMAVPGPVTSAMSSGTHELLRHGEAGLVTTATEIQDVLTRPRDAAGEPAPRPVGREVDTAADTVEADKRGIDVRGTDNRGTADTDIDADGSGTTGAVRHGRDETVEAGKLTAGTVIERYTEAVRGRRVRSDLPCCARVVLLAAGEHTGGEGDPQSVVCTGCGLSYEVRVHAEYDGGHAAIFTVHAAGVVFSRAPARRSTPN